MVLQSHWNILIYIFIFNVYVLLRGVDSFSAYFFSLIELSLFFFFTLQPFHFNIDQKVFRPRSYPALRS